MSGISFLMEAQTMRPLNEILQSLKENYGFTEQEIDVLTSKILHFSELSLKAYAEQKRLSENFSCGTPNIKEQ